MVRDEGTTDRLRRLISKIKALTDTGELHWEKQLGSAHRYARLDNNLLILGPSAALHDKTAPRYLFVTPFDSPHCIEVNTEDAQLGRAVLELVASVESVTRHQKPTDPFALTKEFLAGL